MTGYLQVLALALLPGIGSFLGGLTAEVVAATSRTLSRALHAAAGIAIAVVAVEMMPEVLRGAPPWAIVVALCAGGAFYVLLEWAIGRMQGGEEHTGAWMIYVAVAIDLFGDGLMIGVGSVVSFELGLILALGQAMADAPEGFATISNFRHKGQPRARRFLLSASLAIPCLAGASIGYWLLRDQSEALQLSGLAFTAGILLIAAVEEMMREAHEAAEDTHGSAGFFIGGFALFVLVSSWFDVGG